MYSHVRIGQFTGRMISGRVVPGTQNLKQLWLVKWLPIDLLKFRGPKKVRPKRANAAREIRKLLPQNRKTRRMLVLQTVFWAVKSCSVAFGPLILAERQRVFPIPVHPWPESLGAALWLRDSKLPQSSPSIRGT